MKNSERIDLNETQMAVLKLIKNYGTMVNGEEYRLKQVARAIDQMYSELNEAQTLLHNMTFVKVVPRTI